MKLNNEKELKLIYNKFKKKTIKIFIIKVIYNNEYQLIGLVIRGDHQLDINKINKIKNIILKNNNVNLVNKKVIHKIINNQIINLSIPLIIDIHIACLKNILPIVIINNIFYKTKTLNQNFNKSKIFDIIYNNKNKINKIKKCIEIAHIFQIGKKYSKIFNATINNHQGNKKFIYMGCYGIGLTRLVSAIIEQHHDYKGIMWPNHIAPFQVLIIPINFHKNKQIKNTSKMLYEKIKKSKITVLLEDRKERLGNIFSDANLIGIPNIIIINQNTIENNIIEYQERKNIYKKKHMHIKKIIPFIINKLHHIT